MEDRGAVALTRQIPSEDPRRFRHRSRSHPRRTDVKGQRILSMDGRLPRSLDGITLLLGRVAALRLRDGMVLEECVHHRPRRAVAAPSGRRASLKAPPDLGRYQRGWVSISTKFVWRRSSMRWGDDNCACRPPDCLALAAASPSGPPWMLPRRTAQPPGGARRRSRPHQPGSR